MAINNLINLEIKKNYFTVLIQAAIWQPRHSGSQHSHRNYDRRVSISVWFIYNPGKM